MVRIDNEREEFPQLDRFRLKPIAFDRLFEWAFVTSAVPTSDRSRTMQCVLKPAPELFQTTNSLQRVSVRLYGFLGKHNLTPTGNWNRYVSSHPPRSIPHGNYPTPNISHPPLPRYTFPCILQLGIILHTMHFCTIEPDEGLPKPYFILPWNQAHTRKSIRNKSGKSTI